MNNTKQEIELKIKKLQSIDLGLIQTEVQAAKLWSAYSTICKKKCELEEKSFTVSQENNSKLETMNFYNYFDFKDQDCSLENEYLLPLFEQLETYYKKPSPKLLRGCLKNTTVGHATDLIKGMVFCDKISNENLTRLREYLIKSGIKEVVESYYGCNSGVTNVRLSRWSHNPQDKNTHVEEKFAEEPNGQLMKDIGFHHDAGLPDDVVKVFIYKSANSNNKVVNEKHGLTQILVNNSFITSTFREYGVIVFNSKKISHQSPCPAFEHDRDSIEVTILPRLEEDFLIVQAGNMAGMSKNPFQPWEK